MHNNDKISAHFTLGELTFSDTAARQNIDNTPSPDIIEKLTRIANEILEPVRIHYGVGFRPNSCYRCPTLNKAVGSSSKSQHCKGEAVDIEVPGISNYDLAKWITENLEFDQIILENYRSGEPTSGWVHVSLKPAGQPNRKVALTYSNRHYTNGLHA